MDAKEYAVFLLGLDGRLICWNPGAESLFGYRSDEIIGDCLNCPWGTNRRVDS